MRKKDFTVLLASLSLPSARQLAATAQQRYWHVHALDDKPDARIFGDRTFYGGTDRAAEYAARFELALIEPPLDLLARVPPDLLLRPVRCCDLADLPDFREPLFVKPADPIAKIFDAGVYRQRPDLRARTPSADVSVLVSQPVDWTSEFRCFVHDGDVAAWSPYLSFGRPVWKPQSAGPLPASLTSFCGRLVQRMADALPPAFVVDVGVLEDGRWAVVEFNPAWCSGILGANVEGALSVIRRAAQWIKNASINDRKWVRL